MIRLSSSSQASQTCRADVGFEVLLQDTRNSRQLDLNAWGLRGLGCPICGDATIVLPFHGSAGSGKPLPVAPDRDGASFEGAA